MVAIDGNRLVLATFTMEPVYQAASTSREVDNYWGGVAGYRTVATRVCIGQTKTAGSIIILINRQIEGLTIGQTLWFNAMRKGTTNYNGQPLNYGITAPST